MELQKRTYTDGETVINAKNLNDIQDAIIDLEEYTVELSDDIEDGDAKLQRQVDNFKNRASAIEGSVEDLAETVQDNKAAVDTTLLGYGTNLEFDEDTSLLYLINSDGERISDGISISTGGGGGGGGGGGNNAKLTVKNNSGWTSKTVAYGGSCKLYLNWTSIEDNLPTGNGNLRVTVNNIIKASIDIAQGDIVVDVSEYLNEGANTVKVRISDIYDNSKTVAFSIKTVNFSISSTFDTSTPYTDDISVPFTPVGAGTKTVYFVLDGTTIGTQTVTSTGRQLTYVISPQSHGEHSLKIYFTAVVDGETVSSNELYYEFAFVVSGNTTPIITSGFNKKSVSQYDSVVIPYRVYDPVSSTAQVVLYVGETIVATLTVDRTEHTYTYRASEAGEVSFSIASGNKVKTIEFTVEEVQVDVEAETEDLVLYLNAIGRSNQEETKNQWKYGTIEAQFTDFTWVLDGWQKDSDGVNVMRVIDDARITIPYKIFENDFKTTGKTIEIEFSTREVTNYDAPILTCLDGTSTYIYTAFTGDSFETGVTYYELINGSYVVTQDSTKSSSKTYYTRSERKIGLQITSQSIIFNGAQTSISTLYKDNEHVRLTIVVTKQADYRLILVYINGVMSRAIQYASGERFSQLSAQNISIGSSECGIDIYCIRVYDNNLSRIQVLDNWIADTQVGEEMVKRYRHNKVYNDSGDITIPNLPSDLPYMIVECEELPQYKGDKKTCSGSYVDPVDGSKSFTFTGCQINVQGTSSAIYYRKNYDMQFKNGFVINGQTVATYALKTGHIPFDRFVLKADVASSESANNTVLSSFYTDSCPYKTPAMVQNPLVRYGIEGVPIVLFWYNPTTQETSFMGKYNFNLPKRAAAPYGYDPDDTSMESWEVERNNSSNVKFQDDDFTSQSWSEEEQQYYPTWYDDWEARFPEDTYRDYTKLKEFISWVKSTWRGGATGDAFPTPKEFRLDTTVTVAAYPSDSSYTVVDETEGGQPTGYKIFTFTKDTEAYRLTKFRAELGDYVELQSALYYYLYTELFLQIDSRAKNMFLGFDGSEIT